VKVLIDGKYFTWTENPVQAYDIYENIQIIKPIDYQLYNFTIFEKLVIDGLIINR
jgi:hypothetical protein